MVLAALLEAGWIDTIVDMKALRSHEVWKLPCFVHADRCTSATLLFLNAFLHFEAKFEAPAPDSATLEWSQAMLKLVLAMPSSISGRGLYTTAEAQVLQTGVPSIELYFLSLLQLHRCTGNVGHIVHSQFARFALLPIRPIDAGVQFARNEILLDNICVRAQLGDRPSMLMETDAEMMAQASTSTLLGTGLLDVSHEFAQCVLKAVDRALLKCQKAQPIGAVTELVGTLECFFVSICATDCLADSDTKHEAATLLPKAFRLLLSAAAQMKSNLDLLQDVIAPISQFLSHLLHLPRIDQTLMAIPGIPHVLLDLAQLCGEIWESHDQLPSGQSSGRAVHRNGSLIRVSQADVELDDMMLDEVSQVSMSRPIPGLARGRSTGSGRFACKKQVLIVLRTLHELNVLPLDKLVELVERGWTLVDIDEDPFTCLHACELVCKYMTATHSSVLVHFLRDLKEVIKERSTTWALRLLQIVQQVACASIASSMPSDEILQEVYEICSTITKVKRIFSRDVRCLMLRITPDLHRADDKKFSDFADDILCKLTDVDYAVRFEAISAIRYLFRTFSEHNALFHDVTDKLPLVTQEIGLEMQLSTVLVSAGIMCESPALESQLVFHLSQYARNVSLKPYVVSSMKYAARTLQYPTVQAFLEEHLPFMVHRWLQTGLLIQHFPTFLLNENMDLKQFLQRYSNVIVPIATAEMSDSVLQFVAEKLRMSVHQLLVKEIASTFALVYTMSNSNDEATSGKGHRALSQRLAHDAATPPSGCISKAELTKLITKDLDDIAVHILDLVRDQDNRDGALGFSAEVLQKTLKEFEKMFTKNQPHQNGLDVVWIKYDRVQKLFWNLFHKVSLRARALSERYLDSTRVLCAMPLYFGCAMVVLWLYYGCTGCTVCTMASSVRRS